MYTIYDYVDYYKKDNFEEEKFNIMDNVLFSLLAYLPIEKIKFKDNSNISEIYKELKDVKVYNKLANKALEILKRIYLSNRYKDIQFLNFSYKLDEKIQFCAITFKNNYFTYVAFRGTDGSITGWEENFKLSYIYPSLTQKEAIKYVDNIKDEEFYVGGHSKGGNLAMVGSLESKNFSKVKKVFNNDGPGFLKDQFNSKKYNELNKKLINILPEDSVVGILLHNKDYNYIKSTKKGVLAHDLTTWTCFGKYLVEGELSKSSKAVKDKLLKGLEEAKPEDLEIITNKFFDLLRENNIEKLRDVKKLNFQTFTLLMNDIKNVDESTKKLFIEVIKTFAFS